MFTHSISQSYERHRTIPVDLTLDATNRRAINKLVESSLPAKDDSLSREWCESGVMEAKHRPKGVIATKKNIRGPRGPNKKVRWYALRHCGKVFYDWYAHLPPMPDEAVPCLSDHMTNLGEAMMWDTLNVHKRQKHFEAAKEIGPYPTGTIHNVLCAKGGEAYLLAYLMRNYDPTVIVCPHDAVRDDRFNEMMVRAKHDGMHIVNETQLNRFRFGTHRPTYLLAPTRADAVAFKLTCEYEVEVLDGKGLAKNAEKRLEDDSYSDYRNNRSRDLVRIPEQNIINYFKKFAFNDEFETYTRNFHNRSGRDIDLLEVLFNLTRRNLELPTNVYWKTLNGTLHSQFRDSYAAGTFTGLMTSEEQEIHESIMQSDKPLRVYLPLEQAEYRLTDYHTFTLSEADAQYYAMHIANLGSASSTMDNMVSINIFTMDIEPEQIAMVIKPKGRPPVVILKGSRRNRNLDPSGGLVMMAKREFEIQDTRAREEQMNEEETLICDWITSGDINYSSSRGY